MKANVTHKMGRPILMLRYIDKAGDLTAVAESKSVPGYQPVHRISKQPHGYSIQWSPTNPILSQVPTNMLLESPYILHWSPK